jgi:Glycosyltransferase WbsX
MAIRHETAAMKLFISGCLLLTMLACYAVEKNDVRPIVGAIRWDAWYGESSVVSQVEATLGQPKYHFRLPWFAQVLAPGQVRINGDRQEIIEQEIAYAATAGLDYWAFVNYWDELPSMMIALKRYRAAADKRGVRYCLVEEGGRLDGLGTACFPRLVEHFTDPNYQTVLDGRPLLFLFAKPTRFTKDDWIALGRMAIAAGSKPPYIVLMGWNPTQDAKDIVTLGFDAVSAYARPGTYTMQPPRFAQVREQIRDQLWEKCVRERIPSLTFVSAGWDTRPRNERPPSWIKDLVATPDPTPLAEQRPLIDAVTATPDELAAHVRDAVAWTTAHRDLNPSNAIVIYGWNEHDEGGWLMPTLGADGKPNDDRVKALGSVLRPAAR